MTKQEFTEACKRHPANVDLSESEIRDGANRYWNAIDGTATATPDEEADRAVDAGYFDKY